MRRVDVDGLESSCALLQGSDIFDAPWYREQIGNVGERDPVRHYVEQGWMAGVEPSASFPGAAFEPYFASAGFLGAPAVTWLMLRQAGWSLPRTLAEAEWDAAIVRSSTLFDAVEYARRTGITRSTIDPALHYVLVGERLGVVPGVGFDPHYYAARYPDIGSASINRLIHYIQHGRGEGRRGTPAGQRTSCRVADPKRPSVLLVVHETSRTGAPILGWNIGTLLAADHNVYTLYLGDGALTPAFQSFSVETIGPFMGVDRNRFDVGCALQQLLQRVEFRFALVNSAEARMAVETLASSMVATIFLMHEFASYVFPSESLGEAFDWASEIVFPASLVARAAVEAYPPLRARPRRVLAQGMSIVPGREVPAASNPVPIIADLARRRHEEGTFVVLGAGLVQIRKGVDIFIATAASLLRLKPPRPIHFLWVGQGYHPHQDMAYSVYLHEQLHRSGIAAHVTFQNEVEDLEAVYGNADAFLLSSRLDPLPNVCIDAAVRGIPLVCFREATGIADILSEDTHTSAGVVDHLDADGAARALFALVCDEERRRVVSEATRRLAAVRFDMIAYVATLSQLGAAAADRMAQRVADAETLETDASFDQEMFLGPAGGVESRRSSIIRYLTFAAARSALEPARRPSPGFHPPVYAAAHPALAESGADPLADFVRRGRPDGAWQARVIRIDAAVPKLAGSLRIAVHAHLYYPELASDLLARLTRNLSVPDLLISTDDEDKAAAVRKTLGWHAGGAGRSTLRVFPNRGRNFGPLLTGFGPDLASYDLVCHVHGKRSPSGGTAMGDGWRDFLWQNLIGGRYPSMDHVVAQFEADPTLGVVFAADPHLLGWSANLEHAISLMRRMRLDAILPEAFDFPNGGMFWARPGALQPLLDLRLGWQEYPEEPLPYDGTLLHAIERLPVFVAAETGFGYAVTHVPGTSWAP